MSALADVILPVFLVVGMGYVAVWLGYFDDALIDALMRFAQGFAIPCLLFRAIAELDLAQDFDLRLLGPFYAGAMAGFLAGLFGARYIFKRDWEDAVAIGFVGLFSNSVLLGLPITERAYGAATMPGNYAIVSIHAPFCYITGITAMEVVRNRGERLGLLPRKIGRAVFSNALIIGIGLGFAVNLSGLALPRVVMDGLSLVISAALPAALFGLGGVLYRYKPEGDWRTIGYICAVSLMLHPAVTYGLGRLADLPREGMRSAVLTAAMAPGVNAYLFANMYGRARRVAASAVLLGTVLTILTAWGWLHLLP